jgi:rod shape-determining protein MreC
LKQRKGSVLRLATPIKVLVQRFAFLALIAATFALMMLGKADVVVLERARSVAADAVAPILDALSRPAATVSEMADRVHQIVTVDSENARLREENERLLHWQHVARELAAENEQLKTLLNFQTPPAQSFITARVVADAGGAFVRSVLVNAGTREGVKKGEAAVTGDGLVGRVITVGERSARILLITDLNSRIPVELESSREQAMLAGDNTDLPQLVHLAERVPVSVGDRVVTSGRAGAFPPGLPVGVVTSVNDSDIRVQPYIAWSRLEFVRVIDFGTDGILAPTFERPEAKR